MEYLFLSVVAVLLIRHFAEPVEDVVTDILPSSETSEKSYLGKPGLPSALRNNNPLNLRISKTPWKGKIALDIANTDGRFEKFKSWYYGLRAGIINARTWHVRGYNTPAKLVGVWAPPSDGNNTSAYAQRVADAMQIHVDQPFFWGRDVVEKMVKEMAEVESGIPNVVTSQDFAVSWSML